MTDVSMIVVELPNISGTDIPIIVVQSNGNGSPSTTESSPLLNGNSISSPKSKRHTCFKNMMPDWNNPTQKRNANYDMIDRYRAKDKDFLEKFFEANTPLEACYRHVFVRIIYQMLFEFGVEHEKITENNKLKESTETQKELNKCNVEFAKFLEKLLLKTYKLEDEDCKKSLLKVIAVFWLTLNNVEKNKIDEFKKEVSKIFNEDPELKTFLKLVILLKNQSTAEFQEEFEILLKESQKTFGDYYIFAIKHHVRLLSFTAKRLHLQPSVNLIFSHFPHIGINSTILTSLQETELFTAIIIEPFKSTRLEKCVSTNRMFCISVCLYFLMKIIFCDSAS